MILRFKYYLKKIAKSKIATSSSSKLINILRGRRKLDDFLLDIANAESIMSQHDFVRKFLNYKVVSEYGYHSYLSRLLYLRKIELLEIFIDDSSLSYERVNLFYKYKLSQFKANNMYGLDEIVSYCESLKSNYFLKNATLSLVFDRAIKDGNAEHLAEIIINPKNKYLDLDKGIILGATKLFIKCNKLSFITPYLSSYLKSLPSLERLYFYEPIKALPNLNIYDGLVGWRSVLKELHSSYKPVDKADREIFENYIVNKLSLIPESTNCDFMNIRFDLHSRSNLSRRISESLKNKKPLSFIRLGDGEAYAYDATEYKEIESQEFDKDNVDRENTWWGQPIPSEVSHELRKNVRIAVANADILGVPSVYRIIRDIGNNTRRFGHNRAQRGLLVVLSALGREIEIEDQVFTEDRCHHFMFGKDYLEKLSEDAEKVVVVSCWALSQLGFSTSRPVEFITVSPHTKVSDAVLSESSSQRPIFENYLEIAKQIESISCPGALVLVAAGFAGKVFLESARKSGAVALDIGAMADYFADYKTRTVGDLI